jgi:hypothetical protein
MQLVAPRGLSARPTPIGCSGAAASAPAGPTGPTGQLLEEVEGLQELERQLLETRPHVPDGPPRDDGLEPVVGKTSARRAGVLREPRRTRGRPDGAEPLDRYRGDDAYVRQPVLEGRVEEELAPAAGRVPAERRNRLSPLIV